MAPRDLGPSRLGPEATEAADQLVESGLVRNADRRVCAEQFPRALLAFWQIANAARLSACLGQRHPDRDAGLPCEPCGVHGAAVEVGFDHKHSLRQLRLNAVTSKE